MSSLSGDVPPLSANAPDLRCVPASVPSLWVYHRGLDGLRGVAVALVLVFHLWPGLLVGAWLGVGLFLGLIYDGAHSWARIFWRWPRTRHRVRGTGFARPTV